MGDNCRESMAYGCAAAVIVGTILIVVAACLLLKSVAGGEALLLRAIVTAPTATPLGGVTGRALRQQPDGQLRYLGATVEVLTDTPMCMGTC